MKFVALALLAAYAATAHATGIATTEQFCNNAVVPTGVIAATAMCTAQDGSASQAGICSCGGKNMAQIAANKFCFVNAAGTGVQAESKNCATFNANQADGSTTSAQICSCGTNAVQMTAAADQFCKVTGGVGVKGATAMCTAQFGQGSQAGICSCGKDMVQIAANKFCFTNAAGTGAQAESKDCGTFNLNQADGSTTSAQICSCGKNAVQMTAAADQFCKVTNPGGVGVKSTVLACTGTKATGAVKATAVSGCFCGNSPTAAPTAAPTAGAISNATSNATKAPTAAPTAAGTKKYKDITQTATIGIAKADYINMVKQLTERAMGITLGICSGNCTSWTSGYTMSSLSARRASCTVTFTVGTPQTEVASTGVLTKGKAITSTTFKAAMVALKAADTTYAAVTAPTVKSVTTPKGGAVAASASTTTVGIFSALCLAVAALRQ